MPRVATAADTHVPPPNAWFGDDAQASKTWPPDRTLSGFREEWSTVSINAAHFTRSSSGNLIASWHVLDDLGISGASAVFGNPGRTSPYGPISTATNLGAPHLAS